jgi:hypothetical protein
MNGNGLIERTKKAIRRRLKKFELESGINLSLRLKKEKWVFIQELIEFLNKNTIYLDKGYTLIISILIPTLSGRLLVLQFFISFNGYSVRNPYFSNYIKSKKPTLVIEPSFLSNSARAKYNEFVKQKGLVQGDEYLREIVFTLDKSEYKLFEYLI